jgi:hypothetical protein
MNDTAIEVIGGGGLNHSDLSRGLAIIKERQWR